MATATITFTDLDDDQVSVKASFDPSATDDSAAHRTAMKVIADIAEDHTGLSDMELLP